MLAIRDGEDIPGELDTHELIDALICPATYQAFPRALPIEAVLVVASLVFCLAAVLYAGRLDQTSKEALKPTHFARSKEGETYLSRYIALEVVRQGSGRRLSSLLIEPLAVKVFAFEISMRRLCSEQ